MTAPRFGAAAVLLDSGLVLIAGGFDGTNLPAAAEIYNPGNNQFTGAGPSLSVPRFGTSATLLNGGKVLVAGGSTCNVPGCPTNAAEIYDPVGNTFSVVSGGMGTPRFNQSATLLTNGDVLVAGGYSSCGSACSGEASTELFDPVIGAFSPGQSFATARAAHTGTLLANGNVLLIGGINGGVTLASAESYQPTSLSPSSLVSISVAPASLFLSSGQTQQLVATGTYNDDSTQTLHSLIWTSSTPGVATVSDSAGSAGIVDAQSTGATVLTATTGYISGASSLHVGGLASLTISPTNPSITLGVGQQMTATGTFSDGSTQDLTTSVTWISSNNSILLISNNSGVQGFAMGVATGSASVTATLAGVSASTSVTIQSPHGVAAPTITSVSPTTATAGTQVTISGSSFGSAQGGNVWLGSTYGIVVSWTDTQVIATVASISTSGTAQIQQGGVWSNAVSFNISAATISNVSPNSGVPGTQVTITGSGFGASQDGGQVWLGTANGVVRSWGDSTVVAVVASGSRSGNAQILQNGVVSNAVPFTVNTLEITSVTPSSGATGTTVTITGNGFGSSPGTVLLGSASGDVISWSNTQVVATVAATAVTGVARIEQNGVWSNAVSFTVTSTGGDTLTLAPNVLNIVVGETHTMQALDGNGQPVTGLTWTSSNANVVALSTDDPPLVTGVTAGHATITVGTASADVTVWSTAPPPDTVIWSNAGDGSGVTGIVPAVPSPTGVADMFAFQGDGKVQAITSDGRAAWTADVSGASTVPDFQGGLVAMKANSESGTTTITKFDGMTGQPSPTFTASKPDENSNRNLSTPVVHTDGTIFTVDTTYHYDYNVGANVGTVSVIGIDPTTGGQKFSVPLDQSTYHSQYSYTGSCNGAGQQPSGSTDEPDELPSILAGPMIAGDGYAYVVYRYQVQKNVYQGIIGCVEFDPTVISSTLTEDRVVHLKMLRVGNGGTSNKVDVKEWGSKYIEQNSIGLPTSIAQSGALPSLNVPTPITNADRGTLFTWEADIPEYCAAGTLAVYPHINCNSDVAAASTFGVATTSGGGLGSSSDSSVPGQTSPIYPVLQAQDGSFVGAVVLGSSQSMVAFDTSGGMRWIVPNDYPFMAMADGSVVGYSGTIYDHNGRATGVANLPTQSWTGNGYQISTSQLVQVPFAPFAPATPRYSSFDGANLSQNLTSPFCLDGRDLLSAQYITYNANFYPGCFAFTFFSFFPNDFPFSMLNVSDINRNEYPQWALLEPSMQYGLERILSLYGNPITVDSGYRSPRVNQIIIPPGDPHSRHIHGDAADIVSSATTWKPIHDAALNAGACVEPLVAQKNNPSHVHADWRPLRLCSSKWRQ